jgi:hypothetical protein
MPVAGQHLLHLRLNALADHAGAVAVAVEDGGGGCLDLIE